MKSILIALTFLLLGLASGIWLTSSESGQAVAQVAREQAADVVVKGASLGTRERIMIEHPEIMAAISRGGSFGGKHSTVIAMDMFTMSGPGIEEAKKLSEIVEVAPRSWLIRLPIVNAALFETDDGLVLVHRADNDAFAISRLQDAGHPAIAVGAGLGLDGHLGTDGPLEVGGTLEGPLEARTGDLQGVGPGNEILVVEGTRDLAGDPGDGVHPDSLGMVDH